MRLQTEYRPRSFAEVVGQATTVLALRHMASDRKVPATLLLAGPAGVGKTTLARVFAAALNCEVANGDACGRCLNCNAVLSGSDYSALMEIDAASHGGVEYARWLVDRLRYSHPFDWTVVLFDEAHRVTREAFDVMLKPLEEAPLGQCYIFVSTAPEKIPKTVLSRAIRFDLGPVEPDAITERLVVVCDREGIVASTELLGAIAEEAGGSVRDALNLVEKCVGLGVSDAASFREKFTEVGAARKLLEAAEEGDFALGKRVIGVAVARGEVGALSEQMMSLLMDALAGEEDDLAGFSQDDLEAAARIVSRFLTSTPKPGRAQVGALFMDLVTGLTKEEAATGSAPPAEIGSSETSADPDWWLEKSCANPVAPGRKPVRLQTGELVTEQRCGKCASCSYVALAEEFAAVGMSEPNVLARLDSGATTLEKIRRRANRLRRATDSECAWYAEVPEEALTAILTMVFRVEDEYKAFVAMLKNAAHRQGATIEQVHELADPSALDDEFLSAMHAAAHGPLAEAEKLLSVHRELNGRDLIHVSDGFWQDYSGVALQTRAEARRTARLAGGV